MSANTRRGPRKDDRHHGTDNAAQRAQREELIRHAEEVTTARIIARWDAGEIDDATMVELIIAVGQQRALWGDR